MRYTYRCPEHGPFVATSSIEDRNVPAPCPIDGCDHLGERDLHADLASTRTALPRRFHNKVPDSDVIPQPGSPERPLQSVGWGR